VGKINPKNEDKAIVYYDVASLSKNGPQYKIINATSDLPNLTIEWQSATTECNKLKVSLKHQDVKPGLYPIYLTILGNGEEYTEKVYLTVLLD